MRTHQARYKAKRVIMAEARSNTSPRMTNLVALGLTLAALITPIPHARAEACIGRYTVSTDMTTVTDNDTHLTWQRKVETSAGMPCLNGGNGCRTWQGAKSYCSGLALAGGGWRLPHVLELLTIADEATSNPAIDPTAFPSTPTGNYWVSTPWSGDASAAWGVSFVNGAAGGAFVSDPLHVRCVR